MFFFLSFLFVIILFLHINDAVSESTVTPIEIENPVFTTKGVDEMPYTIKATLGIRRGDDLELFEIEGKIKNSDNIWIYLKYFLIAAKTLSLSGLLLSVLHVIRV